MAFSFSDLIALQQALASNDQEAISRFTADRVISQDGGLFLRKDVYAVAKTAQINPDTPEGRAAAFIFSRQKATRPERSNVAAPRSAPRSERDPDEWIQQCLSIVFGIQSYGYQTAKPIFGPLIENLVSQGLIEEHITRTSGYITFPPQSRDAIQQASFRNPMALMLLGFLQSQDAYVGRMRSFVRKELGVDPTKSSQSQPHAVAPKPIPQPTSPESSASGDSKKPAPATPPPPPPAPLPVTIGPPKKNPPLGEIKSLLGVDEYNSLVAMILTATEARTPISKISQGVARQVHQMLSQRMPKVGEVIVNPIQFVKDVTLSVSPAPEPVILSFKHPAIEEMIQRKAGPTGYGEHVSERPDGELVDRQGNPVPELRLYSFMPDYRSGCLSYFEGKPQPAPQSVTEAVARGWLDAHDLHSHLGGQLSDFVEVQHSPDHQTKVDDALPMKGHGEKTAAEPENAFGGFGYLSVDIQRGASRALVSSLPSTADIAALASVAAAEIRFRDEIKSTRAIEALEKLLPAVKNAADHVGASFYSDSRSAGGVDLDLSKSLDMRHAVYGEVADRAVGLGSIEAINGFFANPENTRHLLSEHPASLAIPVGTGTTPDGKSLLQKVGGMLKSIIQSRDKSSFPDRPTKAEVTAEMESADRLDRQVEAAEELARENGARMAESSIPRLESTGQAGVMPPPPGSQNRPFPIAPQATSSPGPGQPVAKGPITSEFTPQAAMEQIYRALTYSYDATVNEYGKRLLIDDNPGYSMVFGSNNPAGTPLISPNASIFQLTDAGRQFAVQYGTDHPKDKKCQLVLSSQGIEITPTPSSERVSVKQVIKESAIPVQRETSGTDQKLVDI